MLTVRGGEKTNGYLCPLSQIGLRVLLHPLKTMHTGLRSVSLYSHWYWAGAMSEAMVSLLHLHKMHTGFMDDSPNGMATPLHGVIMGVRFPHRLRQEL